MHLQVPQERGSHHCAQPEADCNQSSCLSQDETDHLTRSQAESREDAQLARALKDGHEHGIHDADDRHQKDNHRDDRRATAIEPHVFGQLW